jgi:two-component system, sensor histidine kinase and response regulator
MQLNFKASDAGGGGNPPPWECGRVSPALPDPHPTPTPSPAPAPSPFKANILLVDDRPENLIAIEAILTDLDQNILKASSGEEALRLLLRLDFAAILLDVNMPGMNGFETAVLIRQRKNSEHTPIIFISAISTSDMHIYKGYSLGAVDYLFTPFAPDVLRSKVAVFVDLLRKTEEVKKLNEDLERRATELSQANRELQNEITIRRKAEQSLRETNAELESFSYSVSHDLRAPLRAMQAFAEALLDDCSRELSETGRDFAKRIISAGHRMETLIQDLLVYSRISHLELKLQPVHMEQAIQESLKQLESPVRENRASITIDTPLLEVQAHSATLVQVISNLISNAIKFVAPGVEPDVHIAMIEQQDRARLQVQDNGIGVAPEFQQRIFHVFERLHGIDTYPGTGIGLAIVRKGIERMGGTFGMSSASNQGSCFWIELPLSHAPRRSKALPKKNKD